MTSGEELAVCCGQVAAVKGGGQVAGSNTLGAVSMSGANTLPVARFQIPGMRKLEKRKLSIARNLLVRLTVAPKSALPTIRCELEGPSIRLPRKRLRPRPLKLSNQFAI